MWSWSNIRRHRQQVKTYKTAYKSKVLSQNKLSPDAECQLQVPNAPSKQILS